MDQWMKLATDLNSHFQLKSIAFIRILYEFVREGPEGPELAAALKVLAFLTCRCTNPAAETGRWHVCGTTQEDREAWGDAWHVCGTDLRHLLQPKFTAHFFPVKNCFHTLCYNHFVLFFHEFPNKNHTLVETDTNKQHKEHRYTQLRGPRFFVLGVILFVLEDCSNVERYER